MPPTHSPPCPGPFGYACSTLVALWSALLLAACAPVGEEVFVDPPIVGADLGVRPDSRVSLTATLELGLYREQLYSPFHDGDACPIVRGLQGGAWVIPAVRATGLLARVDVACTVMTADGERVGLVEQTSRLRRGREGVMEIQTLPVPIAHEGDRARDPIDDLYGVRATLTCTLGDANGASARAAVDVELVRD